MRASSVPDNDYVADLLRESTLPPDCDLPALIEAVRDLVAFCEQRREARFTWKDSDKWLGPRLARVCDLLGRDTP